ncbi:MAG: TetR/AcrR family transcriptional regulator [Proteobacteria bacterium]|jgi:AcrR family transcriptional regulator|nr:TetR/AcrR family transcriptional regulator [Pseudomonadota bacterium]
MSKADLAAERKLQIINATIECIARYGYNNFSMQDVARIADVSKGIIHYYFLNKEDLMMAVLDRVAGDIEGLLAGITEKTQDPVEQLRQIMRVCFGIVQQKREYYCINMDFWTQINQKEKVRLAVAKHYGKFRNTTAAIVQAGVEAGTFKPIDPLHAASVIIAIVDGISLQWLFEESSFPYDDMIRTSEEVVLRFLTK